MSKKKKYKKYAGEIIIRDGMEYQPGISDKLAKAEFRDKDGKIVKVIPNVSQESLSEADRKKLEYSKRLQANSRTHGN